MNKIVILKSGYDYNGIKFEFSDNEKSAIIDFLKKDNIITLIGNTSLYNSLCAMCPTYYEETNILLIPFPATNGNPFTIQHNYNVGTNENDFDSIINCIQAVYPWLTHPTYSYLEVSNGYCNNFTNISISGQFFSKDEIEKCKIEFIKLLGSNKFEMVPQKNNIMMNKELSINNLLVSDKIGTIIGESFFKTEAPFTKNIEQVIEFLKNKENYLCTITSGAHQEGFIVNEVYDKIKFFDTLENLVCFDQYNMATTLKDGYKKRANNIWLGYGETTKTKVLKNYLDYLEQNGHIPKKIYGIGDNPIDDLPMLKEIYLRNGQIGFICPYHNLEEMIIAIKKILLNTKSNAKNINNKYEKLYEINIERTILSKYYTAIQNICNNWDWLEPNIYDDAYSFMKRINE